VLLDLDHFKRLNDTLGHEAGDDTLRHVAHVLSAFVRPADHVCRWGGEEFLVILPNADEDLARNIAERLRLRLVDVGVTASFGVAAAEVADTVTRWVRRADDAMYVAKHEGRNVVRVARVTDRLMVKQPEAVGTL
jgi:diguanylate cyclase (GGDEF)-like protein